MGGGYLKGREEVRGYWARQWQAVDSRVEPVSFTERADGRMEVRVDQVGPDAAGGVLFDQQVLHVFSYRGDLVEGMTIEPAEWRTEARAVAGWWLVAGGTATRRGRTAARDRDPRRPALGDRHEPDPGHRGRARHRTLPAAINPVRRLSNARRLLRHSALHAPGRGRVA
jgi:hypothetical protein